MTKYFYSFFFLELSYCVDCRLQESNETYRCCTDKLARTISKTEKKKALTLAYPLVFFVCFFFWGGGEKKKGEGQSKPTKETLGEEKEEIKPKIS